MRLYAATALLLAITPLALPQAPRPPLTPEQTKALIEQREAIEKQLEDVAIIDRKVMVPMRDGKRMAADIYRPKGHQQALPHHLQPHSLQLQLLGRAARHLPRHEPRSSTPSSAATSSSR